MVDLSRIARKLSRSTGPRRHAWRPEVPITAGGATAVALVESMASDCLVVPGNHPAAGSVRSVLKGELADRNHDFTLLSASSTVRALPVALGAALAGSRTGVFADGPDLLASREVLIRAREAGVPLVIHGIVRDTGSGSSGGNSHEVWTAIAAMGIPVLAASTVQEAVDYTLLARRLAEEMLIPVVVGMDGPETALSVQDVVLPGPGPVMEYLGDPSASMHPPTPSQELIFGPHRRRVPKAHDPERPSLEGALQEPAERWRAEAGRFAYLDPHLPAILGAAITALEERTGRSASPVVTHRLDDADRVLVGIGSMVETLIESADRLRAATRMKVGVLGIRQRFPFPDPEIREALRGSRTVAILERTPPRGSVEPPLLEAIRACLARGSDGRSREHPSLVAVYAGPDLDFGAVRALLTRLETDPGSPLLLDVSFQPDATGHPKRQILLDSLRRDYPEAATFSVTTGGDPLPPDPEAVLIRLQGPEDASELLDGAARILVQGAGGTVRTRRPADPTRWASGVDALLRYRPEGPLAAPTRGAPADLLFRLGRNGKERDFALQPGASVLVERRPEDSLWESLPTALQSAIRSGEHGLFAITVEPGEAHRDDRRLGALAGALLASGKLKGKPARLAEAYGAYLGSGAVPDPDARLAAFQDGLKAVLRVETGGLPVRPEPTRVESRPGPEARRIQRVDLAVDSLPRFWDQIGVLYEDGAGDEVSPDPYLATGVLPPLSATFADTARFLETFPDFDPSRCTACGRCWSACPDLAVQPLLLDAKRWIEAGMERAREAGTGTDALRPVVSKLAARVNARLAEPADPGMPAGDLLDRAFESLDTVSLAPDRQAALREAFAPVREQLEPIDVVRTDRFFEIPERDKKGSGELFSLALDPGACTGCGLCVAVCDPGALTPGVPEPERIATARVRAEILRSLPAPSEATRERLARENPPEPVAAALLARETRETFARGDRAEPGSGEKIALRNLLAVVQTTLGASAGPLEELARVREQLGERIRGAMGQALPTADLDALSRGLEGVKQPDVDLADLTSRIEAAFETDRVDVSTLRRLVEIAREIRDLEWRWSQGEGGLGRAPFSLVFAAGPATDWAGSFPRNPFGVPVTLAPPGAAVDLARGLLEGTLRDTARAVLALRRARLELEDPKEAARLAGRGVHLDWRHLNPEERRLCPPLLLIAGEAELAAESASLREVLAEGLPLRIVLLADLDLTGGSRHDRGTTGGAAGPETGDLPLAVALDGHAFVTRTSFTRPDHFERSIREAITFPGAALIAMPAPSPARHGFPTDRAWERADAAVRSRTFTLFRSDPRSGSLAVDLEGNPDPDREWARDAGGRPMTPADWALGEDRFANAFPPRPAGVETVAFLDYLDRFGSERRGRIPVLEDSGGGVHRVGASLVQVVERRRAAWSTLRKLAGTTPAPARATEAVETPPVPVPEPANLTAGPAARLELAREVRSRLLALLEREAGSGAGKTP